jgi:hypothetical protein
MLTTNGHKYDQSRALGIAICNETSHSEEGIGREPKLNLQQYLCLEKLYESNLRAVQEVNPVSSILNSPVQDPATPDFCSNHLRCLLLACKAKPSFVAPHSRQALRCTNLPSGMSPISLAHAASPSASVMPLMSPRAVKKSARIEVSSAHVIAQSCTAFLSHWFGRQIHVSQHIWKEEEQEQERV